MAGQRLRFPPYEDPAAYAEYMEPYNARIKAQNDAHFAKLRQEQEEYDRKVRQLQTDYDRLVRQGSNPLEGFDPSRYTDAAAEAEKIRTNALIAAKEEEKRINAIALKSRQDYQDHLVQEETARKAAAAAREEIMNETRKKLPPSTISPGGYFRALGNSILGRSPFGGGRRSSKKGKKAKKGKKGTRRHSKKKGTRRH